MSISSIQASPHLILERPEHHWPHIFPVRHRPNGQFHQKGSIPLHRDFPAQDNLRQKFPLRSKQISHIDLAPQRFR
jgi:hypothetical protein